MLYIRLIVIAVILTAFSWFVLKLIRKPIHIGLIFIFWVAVILTSMLILYGTSVWLAGS